MGARQQYTNDLDVNDTPMPSVSPIAPAKKPVPKTRKTQPLTRTQPAPAPVETDNEWLKPSDAELNTYANDDVGTSVGTVYIDNIHDRNARRLERLEKLDETSDIGAVLNSYVCCRCVSNYGVRNDLDHLCQPDQIA